MKIFFSAVCFSLAVSAFAQDHFILGDGGHVSDGGGLAEAHIAYSYLALDKFASRCIAKDDCATTATQKEFLKKLSEETATERHAKTPIFKSEKAEPGFFIINGVEQIFKTEPKLGEEIYFNLDKIYTKDASQNSVALPLPALISIVTKAFVSHAAGSREITAEIADLTDRLAAQNWKNLSEIYAPQNLFAKNMGAVVYVEKSASSAFLDLHLSDLTDAFDYSSSFHSNLRDALQLSQTDKILSSTLSQGRWVSQAYHGDYVDMDFTVKHFLKIRRSDNTVTSFSCRNTLYVKLNRVDRQKLDSDYRLDQKTTQWRKPVCTAREELTH